MSKYLILCPTSNNQQLSTCYWQDSRGRSAGMHNIADASLPDVPIVKTMIAAGVLKKSRAGSARPLAYGWSSSDRGMCIAITHKDIELAALRGWYGTEEEDVRVDGWRIARQHDSHNADVLAACCRLLDRDPRLYNGIFGRVLTDSYRSYRDWPRYLGGVITQMANGAELDQGQLFHSMNALLPHGRSGIAKVIEEIVKGNRVLLGGRAATNASIYTGPPTSRVNRARLEVAPPTLEQRRQVGGGVTFPTATTGMTSLARRRIIGFNPDGSYRYEPIEQPVAVPSESPDLEQFASIDVSQMEQSYRNYFASRRPSGGG